MISVVERLLISFSLIVLQFLTDIIYWLEIPAVQDQNWHWIQHKDIFTNQIKRRLGILANHKNSLCSLHLLVATLKPLLNFRLGIYFCYNEWKVWVNDYLKKGQTLVLPAYTGAKLWWDTLSFYFYSLEETNKWIHSVTSVRIFFPVLRNIHITYLAEHINAIVKKFFNMKSLHLSSS